MKILFATTNASKVKYYADVLKKEGFDLLTLKDINLELEVEENGSTPIENAIIKAIAYYNASEIPTIAVDDGLFIDGLDDERQPKNEVRRVDRKRLSDEEMITYYTNIVKKLGGRTTAHWIKGVAIFNGKEIKTLEKISDRVFVDTVSSIVSEGYPLDSITYWDKLNKYTSELTEDEMKEMQKDNSTFLILDFIRKNLSQNKNLQR